MSFLKAQAKRSVLSIEIISIIILLYTFHPDTCFSNTLPKNIKKIDIAVFKIQNYNCSQETSFAIEEILISKLYQTDIFMLLEKSQMDRIAKKNGFIDFDLTNTDIIQKLGKILRVEKIIIGSISKLNGYKLQIRSIDVKTGKIDLSLPFEAENEEELNSCITDAAEKIERYYLGYDNIDGNYELYITPLICYANGSIGKKTNGGAGLLIGFSFNNVITKNIPLSLQAGCIKFFPDNDSIRCEYLFPFTLTLGSHYRISKNIIFTPSIGPGILYSYLYADTSNIKINGKYTFESIHTLNIMGTANTVIDIFLSNRYYLTETTGMCFVFGNSYSILYTINMGVKILL